MFEPREVGLLNGDVEVVGKGYARQPFGERVEFGPALAAPWGRVDGVFLADGEKRVETSISPLSIGMGNTLAVEIEVDVR